MDTIEQVAPLELKRRPRWRFLRPNSNCAHNILPLPFKTNKTDQLSNLLSYLAGCQLANREQRHTSAAETTKNSSQQYFNLQPANHSNSSDCCETKMSRQTRCQPATSFSLPRCRSRLVVVVVFISSIWRRRHRIIAAEWNAPRKLLLFLSFWKPNGPAECYATSTSDW